MVTTQDYINLINDRRINNKSVEIDFSKLPEGIDKGLIAQSLSNGLPKEYNDFVVNKISINQPVTFDYGIIKSTLNQDKNNDTQRRNQIIQENLQRGMQQAQVFNPEYLRQKSTQFAQNILPTQMYGKPVNPNLDIAKIVGQEFIKQGLDPANYAFGEAVNIVAKLGMKGLALLSINPNVNATVRNVANKITNVFKNPEMKQYIFNKQLQGTSKEVQPIIDINTRPTKAIQGIETKPITALELMPIQEIKPNVIETKPTQPLIEEAKKYATPEEFVNSRTYHGRTIPVKENEIPSPIRGNKLEGYEPQIIKVNINIKNPMTKDTEIFDIFNIEDLIDDLKLDYAEFFNLKQKKEAINKVLDMTATKHSHESLPINLKRIFRYVEDMGGDIEQIKKKYDGVIYEDLESGGNTMVPFYDYQINTKQQLIDIWKQANTPTQPIQNAVITPIEQQSIKQGIEKEMPVLIEKLNQPANIPNRTPVEESMKKMIDILPKIKINRIEQDRLNTLVRRERMVEGIQVGKVTQGEKGFNTELSQLSGEFPKVKIIQDTFKEMEFDNLFDAIKNTNGLQYYETIASRNALRKIFQGGVPGNYSLNLLAKTFPPEFIKKVMENRTLFQKLYQAGLEVGNLPRALMSSFDFSAPFRQGIFLGTRHPIRFAQSFPDMFKSFGSEKSYNVLMDSIKSKPNFNLMQESHLALTDLSNLTTNREEKFMSTFAEKIPLIGKGVRASSRAYNAFLSKLRADVFEDLVAKAEKQGLKPFEDPTLTNAIAEYINFSTGRGSLYRLKYSAQILNAGFFSPRLISSRLHILNPYTYINPTTPAFVRKEALVTLLTMGTYTGTLLGLAKLGGAKVGGDPRSADFGKIIIGNSRIDIAGGLQQYMRMSYQIASGEYKSTTSNKVIKLGKGFKPLTVYEILMRQIESKEAPLLSFATTLAKQQDYRGKPVNVTKEVMERFTPMVIGDLIDILKEDPRLLPLVPLNALGFGVQTYKKNKFN